MSCATGTAGIVNWLSCATGDDEIDSLFDLIEHQPKLGGFLGVGQSTYDDYNSEIFRLIKKIES